MKIKLEQYAKEYKKAKDRCDKARLDYRKAEDEVKAAAEAQSIAHTNFYNAVEKEYIL